MKTKKVKSNKKILLWIFFCAVSILLILCLLFPLFASTPFGKQAVLNAINKRGSGKLQVEEFSLSWFKSQTIKGIVWTDQKEQMNLTCEKMTSSSPLWALLFSKHNLGQAKLFSLQVQMKPDFSAPAIIRPITKHEAGFLPKIKSRRKKLSFFGNIEIIEGSLSIFSKEISRVDFQNLNAQINIPKDQLPIHFAIIGQSSQDQIEGKFNIKAEINSVQLSKPSFDVQAKLNHFPIRGIDELCGYINPSLKGLILEAIGPSIDLDLDAKLQETNYEIQLNAHSSLISAQIQTQSQSRILSLKQPGLINFTITPLLMQKIAAHFPNLSFPILKNSPEAQLSLSQLRLPFTKEGMDYSSMAYSASFTLSEADFSSRFDASLIQIQELQISSSTQRLRDTLIIDSTCKLNHGNEHGQISVQGDFGKMSLRKFQGTAQVEIEQFPLAVIDHLFQGGQNFELLLGPALDGKISMNLNENVRQITFRASSPALKISETVLQVNDQIVLKNPFTIIYSPSLSLFNQKLKNIKLSYLSPVSLNIDHLSIPSSGNLEYMQCHGKLSISKTELSDFLFKQSVVIQDLNLQIQIETLKNINLFLTSSHLKAQIEASSNGKLFAIKTMTGQLGLSQHQLQKLFLEGNSNLSFMNPVNVGFSFEPFNLSLSENLLKNLKIAGLFNIDHFSFSTRDSSSALGLKNIACKMLLDSGKETLTTSLSAENANPLLAPTLNLNLTIDHLRFDQGWDASSARYQLSGDLKEFPLDVMETFLKKQGMLIPLLGPSLSMSIHSTGSQESQNISMTAASSQLQLNGSFILKNDLVELKNPLQIKYTLTKNSDAALGKWINNWRKSPFIFDQESQWTIAVDKLKIPLNQKQWIISDASLVGSVNSEKLIFKGKTTNSLIELNKIHLKIDKPNQNSSYGMDFKGLISTKSAASQEFSKEGKWNVEALFPNDRFEQGFANLKITIQKLPSSLLDIIYQLFGDKNWSFNKVLGETVNADLMIGLENFNGPVSMNFQSPKALFSCKGQMKEGQLFLNEPIHAQAMLTADLSKMMLKEVNPFSITSIESNHPMTLFIDSKGFAFPLFPLKKNEINVPNARIELGQVQCKNEGTFNLTLGLLKQNFLKNSTLKLWFTPIDLNIQKGIVNIERTEILIDNSLEICSYGMVDIPQNSVDMVLGLTGQCLKKAFGIKDLPANYVLQIPMRGPIDNVKLDTKKATSKVTSLLLWQKGLAAGGSLKGPAGAIAGELLGKLATLPDRDSKAPPPKRPFPWDEKRLSSKNEETETEPKPPKKKVKIKKKEKPLKQLYKILKS